jgi:hypothetical protein
MPSYFKLCRDRKVCKISDKQIAFFYCGLKSLKSFYVNKPTRIEDKEKVEGGRHAFPSACHVQVSISQATSQSCPGLRTADRQQKVSDVRQICSYFFYLRLIRISNQIIFWRFIGPHCLKKNEISNKEHRPNVFFINQCLSPIFHISFAVTYPFLERWHTWEKRLSFVMCVCLPVRPSVRMVKLGSQ